MVHLAQPYQCNLINTQHIHLWVIHNGIKSQCIRVLPKKCHLADTSAWVSDIRISTCIYALCTYITYICYMHQYKLTICMDRLHMASSFVWIESFTAVHLTSYFPKTGNQYKRSCELDFELSVKQHSMRWALSSTNKENLVWCAIHQFDIPLYRSFVQQSSQQLE